MVRKLGQAAAAPSVCLTIALASVPAAGHEGGHGNQAAWDICIDQQVDDACSYENASHDVYSGSCQRMAGSLMCVRNSPIERSGAANAQPQLQPQSKSAANIVKVGGASDNDNLMLLMIFASVAVCVALAFAIYRGRSN